MSTSVVLPALGESVTEGTVTRWLKKVGDTVEADEGLLEISTDKVDTEIPSPVGGVIEEILVQEDETVEVGAILAKIGDGSGAGPRQEAPAGPPPQAAPAAEAPAEPSPAAEAPRLQRPPSRRPRAEQPAPAAEAAPAGGVGRQGGRPARARRERHRGHDHPLAQAGRRRGRRRRAAARDLDRQGRHRDPVAVRRRAAGDPRPGGRDGRRRLRARPHRRRGCRPGTRCRARAAAAPAPAAEAPAPAPAPAPQPRHPPAGCRSGACGPRSGAPAAPAPRRTGSGCAGPGRARSAAAEADDADIVSYVTPLVRRLAQQQGVDLATVTGTGVGGRIRKEDVLKAAAAASAPAAAEPAAAAAAPRTVEISPLRGTTQPMSRLRKVLAERAVASMQSTAQLTTVVEVDVTKLANFRDKVKNDFLAKTGDKLSFLPFFALAAAEALQAYPDRSTRRSTAPTSSTRASENLSIAVDTERGLLTPVAAGCRDEEPRADRPRDRRPRRAHPRQQAEARRAGRRHLHADQHRIARRAVRHARRVPAAVGDPRHRCRRQAPGRRDGRRQGRDLGALVRVPRALVRPPHHRRRRRRALPGRREGPPRGRRSSRASSASESLSGCFAACTSRSSHWPSRSMITTSCSALGAVGDGVDAQDGGPAEVVERASYGALRRARSIAPAANAAAGIRPSPRRGMPRRPRTRARGEEQPSATPSRSAGSVAAAGAERGLVAVRRRGADRAASAAAVGMLRRLAGRSVAGPPTRSATAVRRRAPPPPLLRRGATADARPRSARATAATRPSSRARSVREIGVDVAGEGLDPVAARRVADVAPSVDGGEIRAISGPDAAIVAAPSAAPRDCRGERLGGGDGEQRLLGVAEVAAMTRRAAARSPRRPRVSARAHRDRLGERAQQLGGVDGGLAARRAGASTGRPASVSHHSPVPRRRPRPTRRSRGGGSRRASPSRRPRGASRGGAVAPGSPPPARRSTAARRRGRPARRTMSSGARTWPSAGATPACPVVAELARIDEDARLARRQRARASPARGRHRPR